LYLLPHTKKVCRVRPAEEDTAAATQSTEPKWI